MKYFYLNTGSQRPHPEDHTRIVAGGAVVEVSEHYHALCEATTNKVGGSYFVHAPDATEETPQGVGEYDHLLSPEPLPTDAPVVDPPADDTPPPVVDDTAPPTP